MPIYTPDNFYGSVFLNGNLIKGVIYADTDNGVVIAYKYPYVINRELGELETYEAKGVVTVKERNKETGEYL